MDAQEMYAALGSIIEDHPGKTMYIVDKEGNLFRSLKVVENPLSDGSQSYDIEMVEKA